MDYDDFREGNKSAEWKKIVSVDKGFFHRVLKVNIYNKVCTFIFALVLIINRRNLLMVIVERD